MNFKVLIGFFAAVFIGYGIAKWGPNTVANSESNKLQKRTISSLALSEDQLVKEVEALIINIKHKSQVLPTIAKIEELSQSNPDNKIVAIYANLVRPLTKLEGIIWRMRPLVEKCGSCHLTALNVLKNTYYRSYLFGPHIKAVLTYLTEPTLDHGQFESVSDLQNYMAMDFRPIFQTSTYKIEQIVRTLPRNFEFDFDNYLVTGYDAEGDFRYVSDTRRYKRVVRGHLKLLLAQKYRVHGLINWSINYNFDKLSDFMAHVVKKTTLNNALNGLTNSLPKNATPKEFLSYLSQPKFRSIGTARLDQYSQKNIQDNLSLSHDSFIKSIEYRYTGIEESISQSDSDNSDNYLIRPVALKINDEDTISNLQERLRIFENAKSGRATLITSKATGRQFEINPSAFFTYHADLKTVFLPKQEFVSEVRGGCLAEDDEIKPRARFLPWVRSVVLGGSVSRGCLNNKVSGQKIHKWDFFYGMPSAWNDPTFGGLFPGATDENFYELLRSVKLTPSTRRMGLILPLL